MSTAAPSSGSSTVIRSHSTSSRFHSYQPPPSDFPHRTRSVAVRPSASSQSHSHHQHSQQTHHAQSYDRRPPSSHAAPDNVARWDPEPSRGSRPGSSRREPSKEHSQERASAAYRTEFAKRHHHRTPSTNSYQREGPDMATTGSAAVEATSGPHGHLPQPASMQPKRRTTITTPSGQWALGKTIGAGSMGKVKLAKNVETGEQVRSVYTNSITVYSPAY